ncbi:MAG: amidase family protein [Sphingomonadaceae bacterium]
MTGMAKAAAISDDDYLAQDALGLAELVRKREVSASELLEMAIERASKQDAKLNFLAQEIYDYGREKIAQGLPEGPFTGVPFLEKDLHMHISGVRSGQGSRLYDDYVPDFTSELVKRHEAAGLVIFGKTTTPEFGLTGTTESLAEGPTRNPWDVTRSSGGSSGGASSAVASGVIPLAHASDGGGSIRIPASTCGLFGLKPSRGRVPMGPLRTEGWGGMSTNGALSRSVRDSAALLDATHGPELGSRYSAPTPDGTFLSQVTREPGSLRIALMLEPISGAPVDPEVVEATRQAAKLCESLGHHVEEASLKIDAARMGQANFALISTALVVDIDARAKAAGVDVGPDVIEKMTMGFYQFGKQVPGTAVASANNLMQEIAVTVARFMANYDVILSPVLASPPAKLGVYDLDKDDFAAWGAAVGAYVPFTGLFNATGQPSMSVPLGMSKGNLPIGSMFTGRYGDEATLLRLAGQLERAAPWFDRLPQLAREI